MTLITTRGIKTCPVLPVPLMSIQCSVHDVLDGGDHKIVLGKVERISQRDPETTKPLLFYRGKYAEIN